MHPKLRAMAGGRQTRSSLQTGTISTANVYCAMNEMEWELHGGEN